MNPAFAKLLLSTELEERLAQLTVTDDGHGYDAFGANAEWARFGAALLRGLYERWFRVESSGIENIPSDGPVILAANHSGTLPFDAAMIWADVIRKTRPPRLVRPVADHFVPRLPFINTLLSRAGTVGGSRGNVRHLLERGEVVLIFPEGTGGIGKPFRDRYQLQAWHVGHVEVAIRHGAPVVPVAVVGAEEQMPQLGRLPIRLLGAPYIPVVASPIPLPVRYHIRYGDPIRFDEAAAEAADDPRVVADACDRVERAVEELIARGLAEREGVFR